MIAQLIFLPNIPSPVMYILFLNNLTLNKNVYFIYIAVFLGSNYSYEGFKYKNVYFDLARQKNNHATNRPVRMHLLKHRGGIE